MKQWHEELPFDFSNPAIQNNFTENSIFFDIETTGFSSSYTSVYLIGCAARNGKHLIVDQFFAETPKEESQVIQAFLRLLAHYDTILTFNGIGFDIPYLKGRCKALGIAENLSSFSYIDIFKAVSRLKFLLKLPNYKQKTIESFLGIGRNDTFHGGELIDIYKEYAASPSEHALFLLKQHNYEDVTDMPLLLTVMSYQNLFDGGFMVEDIKAHQYASYDGNGDKKELLITLKNDLSVPQKASCGFEDFYLVTQDDKSQLRVGLYDGELKFFFDDYKDYCYLPGEDISVHKSVASYVDPAHRKKATAGSCYTKKHAIFLPQYEDIKGPAFRQNKKDKKSYFELTADFASSEDLLHRYAAHILKVLCSFKKG